MEFNKWNDEVTTMKISKDTHKMLMQIKCAYQTRFRCNITLNEIVVFLLTHEGDERINEIIQML